MDLILSHHFILNMLSQVLMKCQKIKGYVLSLYAASKIKCQSSVVRISERNFSSAALNASGHSIFEICDA